jgi:hypothetical protein
MSRFEAVTLPRAGESFVMCRVFRKRTALKPSR